MAKHFVYIVSAQVGSLHVNSEQTNLDIYMMDCTQLYVCVYAYAACI